MLVMVDVDSTLYDADAHFARVAKACGMSWPTKMMYWFTAKDVGYDEKTIKDMFRKAHSREWIMQTSPYPYAAVALNNLAARDDVEVAYVSDRNKRNESAMVEWLREYGFLNAGEQVVCSRDKREWITEHRPHVVIDDRVRTLSMARHEIGAACLAIKQNHNINLVNEIEGVWICDDWYEIEEVLETKILPVFEAAVA